MFKFMAIFKKFFLPKLQLRVPVFHFSHFFSVCHSHSLHYSGFLLKDYESCSNGMHSQQSLFISTTFKYILNPSVLFSILYVLKLFSRP